MAAKSEGLSPEEEWMQQWSHARDALEELRVKELQEMTPGAALATSEALLEIGAKSRLSPWRLQSSGLVEQQSLFHKKKEPKIEKRLNKLLAGNPR